MSNSRPKAPVGRIVKEFLPDLLQQKNLLMLSYGASLLGVILLLLLPWPLKLLIDEVLIGNGTLSMPWMQQYSVQTQVICIALGMVSLTTLVAVLSSLEKIALARARERMALDLRERVLRHIQNLGGEYLIRMSSGELLLRLVDDVGRTTRLFCKTIPLALRYLVTAAFILLATFWIDWRIGLFSLLIVCVLSAVVLNFADSLQHTSHDKRDKEGEVAGFTSEIIQGMTPVQAMGLEEHVCRKYRMKNSRSLAAGVAEVVMAVRMERRVQIIGGISVGLVAGTGGLLVVSGNLTVGVLTVCVAYISQLLKPVEKINETTSAVTRGLARAQKLVALLDQVPDLQDGPRTLDADGIGGELELRDVCFRYSSDSEMILRGLSMSLRPGRLVVILGANGSGKSTLVKLLLRLVQPEKGDISWNGRPIQDFKSSDLHKQFAVCLQDAQLFSGSLRSVLTTLTDAQGESVCDEELWRLLSEVGLDEHIRGLPEQLNTPVDESGRLFSGGQRARILLAQVLLSRRPVLLLDEPLANIDEESGRILVQTLLRYRPGKIILAISHEKELANWADEIYELEQGVIRFVPSANSIIDSDSASEEVSESREVSRDVA